MIIDDYREAYYWLKQNTPSDSNIMSWWDYGYQITGMANRTVLVDNNTWNNTHIATVGKAFASNEEEGWKIARFLGADYVLHIFGGLTNFSGDDISKFLWMIRIGGKFTQPNFLQLEYIPKLKKKISMQTVFTEQIHMQLTLCLTA